MQSWHYLGALPKIGNTIWKEKANNKRTRSRVFSYLCVDDELDNGVHEVPKDQSPLQVRF
ncbi:MAG: hypothetical protein ACMUJM_13740 [bacterium]